MDDLREIDRLSGEAILQIWFGLPEKGSTIKRKILLPKESIFFPFRVDPFSVKALYAGMQTRVHKSCLSCKNDRKFNRYTQPS